MEFLTDVHSGIALRARYGIGVGQWYGKEYPEYPGCGKAWATVAGEKSNCPAQFKFFPFQSTTARVAKKTKN
eukprot:1140465-Pelagomonas_calceolata.AAC.3